MKIFSKNERAQALTEFALVLPIMIGLLFGIVQYGMIFSGRITLNHAAKEAVRLAAVGEDNTAITQRIKSVTSPLPYLNVDYDNILIEPEIIRDRTEDLSISVEIPGSVVKLFGFGQEEHTFKSTAMMRFEIPDHYKELTKSEILIDWFRWDVRNYGNHTDIELNLSISDNWGNLINNAEVVIKVTLPDGEEDTQTYTTNENGQLINPPKYSKVNSGDRYEAEIISITAGSLTWDEGSAKKAIIVVGELDDST